MHPTPLGCIDKERSGRRGLRGAIPAQRRWDDHGIQRDSRLLPDRGYTPIDITSFPALCTFVFPHSHATAQQNREDEITCRTWITEILSHLIDRTHVLQIEQFVTT